MVPNKSNFTLDFEYKKIRPGDLVVKQVREVPPPPATPPVAPFLLNEPTVFGVFQGERGDVFTLHRLKCRLTLNSRNFQMSATNLASGLYINAVLEFVDGAQIVRLTNGPSGWPQAAYFFNGKLATNR
jgi:hypothetical protein